MRRAWVWQLILSYLIVWFAAFVVQYSLPLIIGADGFLHGRMAIMMTNSGFLKSLPEAHFSWFATHFSDKDFLYHIYLIPFTWLFGYIAGTKLGAFLATGILFSVVVWLLSKYTRPTITLICSLAFLLSPQMLRDMAEARPFIWAIIFTLLGTHFVINKNQRAIFIISLIYGMTHLSAWIIPLFSLIVLIYMWLINEKNQPKIFLYALAGYLFSFLLHPNFPTNVFYAYLNGVLVPWYAIVGGVLELGAEFFPLNTSEFIYHFPVIMAGSIFSALTILIYQVKIRRETALWFIMTLLFLIMGLTSRRNLTHMLPLFIVCLGCFVENSIESAAHLIKIVRDRYVSILIPVTGLFFIGAITLTYISVKNSLISDGIYSNHYAMVAKILEEKVLTGSRVFHSNWSDSQYFIGLAPEYQYFVTLDPIYMYSYNKDLYTLYRQVSFGLVKDPKTVLTENFGAYYGYVGKNYFGQLISQIKSDSSFSILYEDQLGIVFAIKQIAS
jgi:hypothetical protein